MYWTAHTGAWEITGIHLLKWASSGYERGRYGYPTGEVKDIRNMSGRQSFQGGTLSEYVPGTANLGAKPEHRFSWDFTYDGEDINE